jgi:hypothetical protein
MQPPESESITKAFQSLRESLPSRETFFLVSRKLVIHLELTDASFPLQQATSSLFTLNSTIKQAGKIAD